MNISRKFLCLGLPMAALLAGCASDDSYSGAPVPEGTNLISASVENCGTRTAINEATEGSSVVALMWTEGDALGVFNNAGEQLKYEKTNPNTEAHSYFKPSNGVGFAPVIAYYPYDAANQERRYNDLLGNVPSTVSAGTTIEGDYKIGAPVANGDNDGTYRFEFRNLMSLVAMKIDATGTPLDNEVINSLTFTVTRNGAEVPFTGDFGFSALEGLTSLPTASGNSLTVNWNGNAKLTGTISQYVSCLPTIKAGDLLSFTVKTANYTSTFAVPCKVNFAGQYIYTFPLNFSALRKRADANYKVVDKDGNIVDQYTPGEEQPEYIEGTFTCATYNVDGLPSFINSDGPGSSGTTLLGQAANNSGWDFFGVSENFEYNSQLVSALTNYNHGTHYGSVKLFGTADTDGLNMFWLKNVVTLTEESRINYTSSYGGLANGANDKIKKGFRYYLATLADGTQIDVYITHMNTWKSGSGVEAIDFENAQHAQLTQLRDYILSHNNGRPIVVMGDTNMRYTRHKMKEIFIDGINSTKVWSVFDPWIKHQRGGVYPDYPSKSLMVSDATGTNSETDIICSTTQNGEVVDKIFVINHTGNDTQIIDATYLRDTSFKKADGSYLADHCPIVSTITYQRKKVK